MLKLKEPSETLEVNLKENSRELESIFDSVVWIRMIVMVSCVMFESMAPLYIFRMRHLDMLSSELDCFPLLSRSLSCTIVWFHTH